MMTELLVNEQLKKEDLQGQDVVKLTVISRIIHTFCGTIIACMVDCNNSWVRT